MNIYVGNLSYALTSEELRPNFGGFGGRNSSTRGRGPSFSGGPSRRGGETPPRASTERSNRGGFRGPNVDQAPSVGDPLPDVILHTADGNEMNLTDLKGSYSVLVFGCLT